MLVFASVAVFAVTLAGCFHPDGDDAANAGCPDPPALADYGAPAPRAPMTTLNLEFGASLVAETVHDAVEIPPTISRGVRVDSVTLQQVGTDGGEANLIAVNLTPWLRLLGSKPVHLQQYVLRAKIVPYIINSSTISDGTRRRQILGTSADGRDSGVVLRMEFYDFGRVAATGKVSCEDSRFSAIDRRVQGSISTGFAVGNGYITTSTTSTTVDGANTSFKEAFAALPQWDQTQWDLYQAEGMKYVGRVAAVADNVTLTLQRPASVALNRQAYVAVRRPLVVPTDLVTNLLKVHPTTGGFSVRGINVASQGALKIGLDVNVYRPFTGPWMSISRLPFTPQPAIQATDDWLITAQTGYVEMAAKAQVARLLEEQGETRVALTNLILTPGPFPTSPIVVTANFGVRAPIYSGPLQIFGQVSPRLRRGKDDQPFLIAPFVFGGLNPLYLPAILVGQQVLDSIGEAYGAAQVASGCAGAIGPSLQFESFGSDVLRSTGIVVNPSPATISISGRSSLIDRRMQERGLPARPPIPKC